MEDTALQQPTMVSRLPKFGFRAPAASNPVPNGFSSALPVSSAGGKGTPNQGKQNGVVRVPPSLSEGKWKKGREESREKTLNCENEARVGLRSQQQQPARTTASGRDLGKPSVVKSRRSIPSGPTTTSGPRSVPQSSRTNPRSPGPKHPSPMYTRKGGVNGIASGLPKPSLGSSSSPLSQSSDSLKSIAVENVVRSQSFSHVKSSTTPASPPLTRSFSFNRAAELAKEMPRPLAQSPLARSPITQPSLIFSGERGGTFGVSKPSMGTNASCPLPPTTLKKSLLPNSSISKPSAVSYKLMRPSLIKQPRSVIAGNNKVQTKTESTQSNEDPQETPSPTTQLISKAESPENVPDEPKEADGLQALSLEVPEDMSLSSTSSLERNDVSEEYMDDFDDLGHGGGGIQLLPSHEGGRGLSGLCEDDHVQSQDGSSVTSLQSFLSETVDWAEMGLTGDRDRLVVSPHRVSMSVGRDLPHGSSLDLSPSDSSGGTYMWDEEVLEPLRGGGAHVCRSYDSDLNSMDILNNLENLESCNLEDDDLMLDAELPEDASLHSDVDGVSGYECSEMGYWPGQWRRRQQCWGRPDQHHNNNSRGVVLQGFDECHLQTLSRRASGHTTLDELMLKHMNQDCSSVKEQLIQLRRILQVEDDGSVDEALEFDFSPSSEESSCQQQVEELLKEVQNLREELREKDRLISKLTQQTITPLEVPQCHCLQGELLSPEQQDKSTQTPLRAHNPQILQPSRRSPSGPHKLERPSSRVQTGDPSDRMDGQSRDYSMKVQPSASVSPDPATSNTDTVLPTAVPTTVPTAATVSAAAAPVLTFETPLDCTPDDLQHLLNTQFTIRDPNKPASNTHHRFNNSHNPELDVSSCVQVQRSNGGPGNQSLDCIKRAAVMLRAQDGSQISRGRGLLGRTGLRPGASSTSRTRWRMPPPNRGLPCISSASQVTVPSSATFSAQNVHNRGLRSNLAPQDVEQNSARAREVTQPCSSRLPKPKSH